MHDNAVNTQIENPWHSNSQSAACFRDKRIGYAISQLNAISNSLLCQNRPYLLPSCVLFIASALLFVGIAMSIVVGCSFSVMYVALSVLFCVAALFAIVCTILSKRALVKESKQIILLMQDLHKIELSLCLIRKYLSSPNVDNERLKWCADYIQSVLMFLAKHGSYLACIGCIGISDETQVAFQPIEGFSVISLQIIEKGEEFFTSQESS